MKYIATNAALAAALTGAIAAAAGCSSPKAAQTRGRDDAVKSIQVEAVQLKAVRRAVEVVGTLAAQEEVTVSSQTEGAVGRIAADLGDRVHTGDVLVALDREKAAYKYDQQNAAYERALAKYGATAPGKLPVVERTPDVERAAAELAQSEQAFQRLQELQRRQLLPQQQLDDANAILLSKRAGYTSALQNAANLRADIDASDAARKLAGRELNDTAIRAPFDGFVQKRMVSQGEFVKTQTPVMVLVKVDPLKIAAEIPERLAPWITLGQPVAIHIDAMPDRTIPGRIARISPAVNTQTRAFQFEAVVPNGDAQLKPGSFARVRLETSKVDQVLTLPYAALQYRYGVNRVFVVDGAGRLSARELTLGDRDGDRVEVASGVKAGDRVALTDVEKLVDGLKVRVGPAEPTR